MVKITDAPSIVCPEACRVTALKIFMPTRVAADSVVIYLMKCIIPLLKHFQLEISPKTLMASAQVLTLSLSIQYLSSS